MVCGFLSALYGALAADPEPNLLINGDMDGQTAPAWSFKDQGSKGKLEHGVAGEPEQRELFIRKLDSIASDNVWWLQKVPVQEGQTFALKFEAKGWGGDFHFISAGADFLASDGHYLGYKEIQKVAYRNPSFPNATVPDVRDWKAYQGEFVTPQGTKWVVLRMALGGTTPAEADFRNISLTQDTVSTVEILEGMPSEIPIYAIPLAPVTSKGVTLTPDWSWANADILQSKTRWKGCLNGLWAIQPADGSLAPPREGDWAFFKVPGYFSSQELYSVYGREKTSWGARKAETTAPGIWYVRDVEIPSGEDRKVFFEIGGMWGYAVRVYWNGKVVGNVTDQLGGRVDLTPFVHAGKGQLALYAMGQHPENRYAFLQEAGVMPRLQQAGLPQIDAGRGFHDLYLDLEPSRAVLDRVEVLPSLKGGTPSLGLRILSSVTEPVRFSLRILNADGKEAVNADAGTGSRDENGIALELPWANPHLWTPDDPYLYTFQVQALGPDGTVLDETLPERFGFREIRIEGKQILFNGYPFHLRPKLTDSGYLDDLSIRRQFALLKDMGFNCVQRPTVGGTHELEDPNRNSIEAYYNIADEMGMLVIPYTPYSLVSGGQFGSDVISGDRMQALIDYVKSHEIQRLFNHPSVIAYSGFGDAYSSGGNYLNFRPDIWGIHPLDGKGVLEGMIQDGGTRAKALQTMAVCRNYIAGIKQADPTRPFLSHLDAGEGDGWGGFDYFNWTPLQEWEDWPRQWAAEGQMPIGSTEHGLPYPASFLNHAPAGGDGEPWATEYAAALLGDTVYFNETPAYLSLIHSSYDKAAGNYLHGFRAIHQLGDAVVQAAWQNVQAVWARQNRAIYRTWRTYGVSMGIEPFGPCLHLIQGEALFRDDGKIVADPDLNLKTVGGKLDLWKCQGYWPREAMPFLSPIPTGKKPDILTPLGDVLHEVNSPFLAYIAGSADRFSEKDHVYWAGETISKQIALIWDGFSSRKVMATWSATLGGNRIDSGSVSLSLNPGQISFSPIQFSTPEVQSRVSGEIELSVKDEGTGEEITHDRFPFSVYPPYQVEDGMRNRKIALYDPIGESGGMFSKLGLNAIPITSSDQLAGCDLLVIGRRAVEKMEGVKLLESLPPGMPVLVLEQTDESLIKMGLRAFPIRPRILFSFPTAFPALAGVGDDDLHDWRVTPKLLPDGIQPLRTGYDFHTQYVGATASVTMEIPTRGNFTPLLRCGFDLRETPLLEANADGRRIIFCQLSLVDGVGTDPVATRIAANLVHDLISSPSPKQASSLAIVGDANVTASWADCLGAESAVSRDVSNLPARGIALIPILPTESGPLENWVTQGGTAIVLPQGIEAYASYFPGLNVESRKESLVPWSGLPEGKLLVGLAQNDFHARQPLDQLWFAGKSPLSEIPQGNGRWILLGFDPTTLPIDQQPYLRLTQRHEYRILSQILTNVGVDLGSPVAELLNAIGRAPHELPLTTMPGTVVRLKEGKMSGETTWTEPAYQASDWKPFDLSAQQTPFAHVFVRVEFQGPAAIENGAAIGLGTIDDYDVTYLNGVRIGGITPENSTPETAWSTSRLYTIPNGLLKLGQTNVLAIDAWNRNAAKGGTAWLRGPLLIHLTGDQGGPYVGTYKRSDDPYLEFHW